jgi:hypothetical protein
MTVNWNKPARCETAACVEVAYQQPSQCENATCVEIGHCGCDGGTWLIRDSKANPDGPVLAFTADEWAAFIAAAVAGQYDQP